MKKVGAATHWVLGFIAISVCFVSMVAQESESKPEVSSVPLSAEQIAVYRAVLKNYTQKTKDKLNVGTFTVPQGRFLDSGCFDGFASQAKETIPILHKLPPEIATGLNIVLVDPEIQSRRIDQNDPQNLIKRGIDGHEKISNEQLEKSIKAAFATGGMSLSEIAFDSHHSRALVTYSFVCGGLCGHGGTLLLQKSNGVWKVKSQCGGWVS